MQVSILRYTACTNNSSDLNYSGFKKRARGFHAEISGIRQIEIVSVWKHASRLCAYMFLGFYILHHILQTETTVRGLQVGGLCENEQGSLCRLVLHRGGRG